MKYKNRFLLVFSSSLLIACGTPYVQPASGPTAILTLPAIRIQLGFFSGSSGGGVRVAEKNEDGCGHFSAIIEPPEKGENFSVSIPATGDVFVGVARTFGNASCSVAGSFSVKPNREYIMRFRVENQDCVAIVSEKVPTGEEHVKFFPAYASAWDGIKVCDAKNKL